MYYPNSTENELKIYPGNKCYVNFLQQFYLSKKNALFYNVNIMFQILDNPLQYSWLVHVNNPCPLFLPIVLIYITS